jgi:HK97 family phage prohead protease
MEVKSLALEVKAEGDEGVITGYGSVFGNVDSYGDVIEPGAFAASITKRNPKMLWQHRMDTPIGVWDEVKEDDRGLFMRGRLATKTAKGKEGLELVKMGALDGLSIGFRSVSDEMDGNTRKLKQIDLYEVSLVTMPANDLATVTGVKNAINDLRDFESLLREFGFNRDASKVIASHGFKNYLDRLREADSKEGQIDQREADDLKSSLEQLLKGVRANVRT